MPKETVGMAKIVSPRIAIARGLTVRMLATLLFRLSLLAFPDRLQRPALPLDHSGNL